jgi:DNA helicase-2/ATP-dependent DNA helicase PcrA
VNAKQHAVVETVDKSAAGPGRCRHGEDVRSDQALRSHPVTKRAFPNQVFAVTFTNNAAVEMRGRVSVILGHAAEASGSAPSMPSAHSRRPEAIQSVTLLERAC